jgi:hypothetical protein
LLDTADAGAAIDTWICALARLHVGLTPYLSRVAAKPQRLVEYYEENSEQLLHGKLGNAFWDDAAEESKVVNWFQSSTIRKQIQARYGLTGD